LDHLRIQGGRSLVREEKDMPLFWMIVLGLIGLIGLAGFLFLLWPFVLMDIRYHFFRLYFHVWLHLVYRRAIKKWQSDRSR
jgi:hypothetical protein